MKNKKKWSDERLDALHQVNMADTVEPAPCSRTALVRDRFIDDIKSGMNTKRFEKVDENDWNKVVQRMKEREQRSRGIKDGVTVTVNDTNNTITIEGNFVIVNERGERTDGVGKRTFQRMVPGYQ
jgi:hypothetical protein